MESASPRTIFKAERTAVKRGPLIAGEGLDGSGKTTVMRQLRASLAARGRDVVLSNWNEATEVYNLMMRVNASDALDSRTRCLFGAAELAARYQYVILPALDRGASVILNKYLLSAYAHSRVRDVPDDFVRRVYDFAFPPDLTLYFRISPETALARKLKSGRPIGFWEAGLDIALGLPLDEAIAAYRHGAVSDERLRELFIEFQGRLLYCHQREIAQLETDVDVIDGTLEIGEVLRHVEDSIERLLERFPREAPRATR